MHMSYDVHNIAHAHMHMHTHMHEHMHVPAISSITSAHSRLAMQAAHAARRRVPCQPPPRWVVADAGKELRREVPGCVGPPAYCWENDGDWKYGSATAYDFLKEEEARSWQGSRCGGVCDLSGAFLH